MAAEHRKNRSGLPPAFWAQRSLPPGVTQADCDGPALRHGGTSPQTLWLLCDLLTQQRIADAFVSSYADQIRNTFLEVQDMLDMTGGIADTTGPPIHENIIVLANLLWSWWIRFRNGALRDMRRRGEFAVILKAD